MGGGWSGHFGWEIGRWVSLGSKRVERQDVMAVVEEFCILEFKSIPCLHAYDFSTNLQGTINTKCGNTFPEAYLSCARSRVARYKITKDGREANRYSTFMASCSILSMLAKNQAIPTLYGI